MACRIIRDEKGSVTEVRAENGKPSIHYQSLLRHYAGNVEKALKAYAMTKTPTFQEWFADSAMVDENGEPQVYYHDMRRIFEVSRKLDRDDAQAYEEAGEIVDRGIPHELVAELTMSADARDVRFTEDVPDIDRSRLGLQEAILARATDGMVTAITGRPVYLYAKVKPEGKQFMVPGMHQVKFVDTQDTYATDQPGDLLMPETVETTAQVIAGGVAKLINLKKNLKRIAESRMTDIAVQIGAVQDDQALLDSLTAEQVKLNYYVNGDRYRGVKGLTHEIKELGRMNSADPVGLRPYITKELRRLDSLVMGNAADVQEARDIIQFLQSVADILCVSDDNKINGHPLFEEAEIFDSKKNVILPAAWVEEYGKWGEAAEEKLVKLNERDKELAVQIINENHNVQDMYNRDLSHDDLVGGTEGFAEVSWFDKYFFDPGSGLSYRNGILTQAGKVVVNEEFSREEAWSQGIANRLDALAPRVLKRMKDKGLGRNYNIFRQKDKLGLLKSNLAGKNSFEWEDTYKTMISRFRKMRNDEEQSRKGPKAKNLEGIHKFRDTWLKKNTKLLNPALIPEIAAMADDLGIDPGEFGTDAEQQAHKEELISIVGQDYYNRLVRQQVNKIKEFESRRNSILKNHLAKEGHTDEADLSDAARMHLKIFDMENDPFTGASYSETGMPHKVGDFKVFHTFNNNIHVPLREIGGKDTGYYDENYEKIEADPVLKEFYDLVYEATSGIWDRLDYKMKKKAKDTTIMNLDRHFIELFLDKDVKFYQALSIAYRRMIDSVKDSFGIIKEQPFVGGQGNVITGKVEEQINASQLKGQVNRVKSEMKVKGMAFMSKFNKLPEYGPVAFRGKAQMTRFGLSTEIDLPFKDYPAAAERILKLAAEQTGLTVAQLQQAYVEKDSTGATVLRIGKAMEASIMNTIAKESSFDLPRVLKLYTNLAGQYAARQRARPVVSILKTAYFGAPEPEVTNAGEIRSSEKKRKRPIRKRGRQRAEDQFNSWVRRVVLGHTGLQKHFGTSKHEMTEQDYKDAVNNKFTNMFRTLISRDRKFAFDGKIYSTKDKEALRAVNEVIDTQREKVAAAQKSAKAMAASLDPDEAVRAKVRAQRAQAALEDLEEYRASLGKDFAASAAMGQLLAYIRFVYIQLNLKASIDNVIIGQISNSLTAVSGKYFPPEAIDETGFFRLAYADFIKHIPFSKGRFTPKKSAKVGLMAEDYNILQDSTNDMQKSYLKSKHKWLRRASGFYLMKKGEYYNQVPLLAAVLKDTPIYVYDKDGNVVRESNVLDAMEVNFNPKNGKWEKKLKPEFATAENVESWENGNSKEFGAFKARINEVISKTHGNYDPLSGMAAKENIIGQTATMFKTYYPNLLAQAFSKEHDDIVTGVKGDKGFMWSHSPLTGAIQGFLLGMATLSPIGGIVGAAVGGGAAFFYGNRNNQMGPLQEMWYVTKLLTRKMLGIPLNPVSRLITGKRFFRPDREAEFKRMSDKAGGFTKVDYGNYQVNIQLIALSLAFIIGELMTKAAFWDDDDDDESTRRKLHNGLMNEFMDLFDQATAMYNPAGIIKTVTDMALLRYIQNLGKALAQLNNYIMDDPSDYNLSGSNMGESKFENSFQKIAFPRLFGESLGYGPSMSRQFEQSPFDQYFWGDEKVAQKEIRVMKLQYSESLQELYPDMEEAEFKKLLNKGFGRKKKGETYVEFRERLKQEAANRDAQRAWGAPAQ